jgi:hypothetical protein
MDQDAELGGRLKDSLCELTKLLTSDPAEQYDCLISINHSHYKLFENPLVIFTLESQVVALFLSFKRSKNG